MTQFIWQNKWSVIKCAVESEVVYRFTPLVRINRKFGSDRGKSFEAIGGVSKAGARR